MLLKRHYQLHRLDVLRCTQNLWIAIVQTSPQGCFLSILTVLFLCLLEKDFVSTVIGTQCKDLSVEFSKIWKILTLLLATRDTKWLASRGKSWFLRSLDPWKNHPKHVNHYKLTLNPLSWLRLPNCYNSCGDKLNLCFSTLKSKRPSSPS